MSFLPSHCRYGLVGRNGTGKTTLLRHLAQRLLKGIPSNCQILHVEQEVHAGDELALELTATGLACSPAAFPAVSPRSPAVLNLPLIQLLFTLTPTPTYTHLHPPHLPPPPRCLRGAGDGR